MKHILNNLSEQEKNNIRKQHTGELKVDTSKFFNLIESKLGNVAPILNEQQTPQMFSFEEQEMLRDLGFKADTPVSDSFSLKNDVLGYTIQVKSVPCSANKGRYSGMQIFINGKEYLNGNYDKCPDACWVILRDDILKIRRPPLKQ